MALLKALLAAAALAAPLAAAELSVPKPAAATTPLAVPHRTLMGPGPSTANPRVLAAGSLPMLGHMHPEFLGIMDDAQAWMRYAFQTSNNMTLAISGTGHAGMEAGVANLVEAGDEVLVGCNGIWGERMADLMERYGAVVHRLDVAPGGVFSLDDIKKGLAAHPAVKVLFLTHGESSTGTLQPIAGVGALCRSKNVLLFLDTVCTLGGVPLRVDEEQVDASYSGSQKCLGSPPGAAPFTMGPRARAKLAARKTKVASYYFDMNLVGPYWGVDGVPRAYHHTGMINTIYSLREALAILAEEGLEAAWARHAAAAAQLHAGLERLGLKLFVKDPAARLPTVTTVEVPAGVVWSDVTKHMMAKFNVEMAGGLGPTVGKVWRIGLMGHNARPGNVALVLHALEDALRHVGWSGLPARTEL